KDNVIGEVAQKLGDEGHDLVVLHRFDRIELEHFQQGVGEGAKAVRYDAVQARFSPEEGDRVFQHCHRCDVHEDQLSLVRSPKRHGSRKPYTAAIAVRRRQGWRGNRQSKQGKAVADGGWRPYITVAPGSRTKKVSGLRIARASSIRRARRRM